LLTRPDCSGSSLAPKADPGRFLHPGRQVFRSECGRPALGRDGGLGRNAWAQSL